jgi:hypothetical protein
MSFEYLSDERISNRLAGEARSFNPHARASDVEIVELI